jgi:hypothetical protein
LEESQKSDGEFGRTLRKSLRRLNMSCTLKHGSGSSIKKPGSLERVLAMKSREAAPQTN